MFVLGCATLKGVKTANCRLKRLPRLSMRLQAGSEPKPGDTISSAIRATKDPALAGRWWAVLAGWQIEDCQYDAARRSLDSADAEYQLSPDGELKAAGLDAGRELRDSLAVQGCTRP